MLSLSTSNKITFNVNVSGTAATPSVRCLIGEHPTMSFPATKLLNDEWEVIIDLPADMKPGTHTFKVEVLLNGRLFTPINYSIGVSGGDDVANVAPAPIVPAPVQVAQANLMAVVSKITEPTPTPTPTPTISVSEQVSKVKPVEVKPVEVKPVEVKPVSSLEKFAKAPVVSKPKPIAEVKHMKISMLDIANEVDKQAVKSAPKKSKPIQEARTQTIPITLIKGAIIYR